MKMLYLIRHCESQELAGEDQPQPRNDSPLSRKGIQQAGLLADHLRASPIDLMLVSPFLRAQQTAEIIGYERRIPTFASTALYEFLLRDDGRGVETLEAGIAR